MSTSEKPDFVLETYIKTTPEQLWQALTDGEMSKHYFQGDASIESSFEVGPIGGDLSLDLEMCMLSC